MGDDDIKGPDLPDIPPTEDTLVNRTTQSQKHVNHDNYDNEVTLHLKERMNNYPNRITGNRSRPRRTKNPISDRSKEQVHRNDEP